MSVTIEYIARMANVSKATVSRVINNKADGVGAETRARILKIINEYEYKPNLVARGMATSKTKTIGLIIPDITNPFFPAVVKSIEDNASANGYTIILCNTDSSPEKEDSSISTLIANRVDGVILASAVGRQRTVHERFLKYGIPCVLIDRKIKSMESQAGVFVDNEYSMFIAAEYLVQNGNSEIALILGPSNLSTSQERLEGYKSALKQYDIPFRPGLVLTGDYSFKGGYDAVMRMKEERVRFTAVLASSDVIAIGAIKALKELGFQIPGEVEVIGFDNIPTSEMIDPPLTTVEQPVLELGEQAVKALLALIEGRKLQDRNIRLESRLVIRKSTK